MAAEKLNTIPKKKGTENLGWKYESQVITLLAASWSQNKTVKEYWIVSNLEGVECFDDIVAAVTDSDGNQHAFFVQLKHSKKVMRLLTSPSKKKWKFTDIALNKCLDSYKKINNVLKEQLKEILKRIPSHKYHYCLFTNVQEVEPKLKLTDISETNPLSYLDVTKCGKVSKWDGNVKPEFASFFEQFYFLTGQPDSFKIVRLLGEALPGFTELMIANLCDVTDESLTRGVNCAFLTKTLFMKKLSNVWIHQQMLANRIHRIQDTKISKQYFNILDTIFTNYTVIKINSVNERKPVKWIYAYYEYKIQELYDNDFDWNKCYHDFFRLHKRTRDALRTNGITRTHLVDLLLDMWEREEIPCVLSNVNLSLFTNQITQTNCRFILVTDPREEIVIQKDINLFQTLYDLREHIILKEIMNIELSLQGRPHVKLNDIIGSDNAFLRDITAADLIRWITLPKDNRRIGRELRQRERDYIERKFSTFSTTDKKSDKIPILQSEKEIINEDCSLNIIVNDAGMGKSTVLPSLALHCNPKNYVIHHNLADCLNDLALDYGPIYDDPIEYFFNKSESSCDTFAYVIYKQHRTTRRLTILIDSFDEILPVYNKKVIAIIKKILTTHARVFLTSRTQAYDQLKEEFKSAKQITLAVFEKPDIESYCEQHGVSISALDILSNDFLAVPLHLNIFTQAHKKFLQGHIQITGLYEEFINRKIEEFCKKKKVTDRNTIRSLEIEKLVLNRHFNLALMYTFGKQLLQDLNIICSEEWDKIIRAFNKYESPIGLVAFIDSGEHIRFVHKTFAEYLVAKWICEHKNEESARELYKEVVKKPEYIQVYRLLDEISCITTGGIFIEILNGDLGSTSLCEESWALEDIWGRSPLHYAASNCYHSDGQQNILEKYKIFENVIALMPKRVKSKDNILCWTPIDFLVGEQATKFQYSIINVACFWHAMESNCVQLTNELLAAYTIENSKWLEYAIDFALKKNLVWIPLKLLEMLGITQENINSFTFRSKCGRKLLTLLLHLDENIKQWIDENKISLSDSHSNKLFQEKIQLFRSQGNAEIQILREGDSLLNLACAFGDVSIVEDLLLSHKAGINALDSSKSNHLHYACMKGQVKVVNILLENEADPNLPDFDQRTSLHYACMEGHLEVVELLLNRGANPNLLDSDKLTSLYYACQEQHVKVVERLLNHEADPNSSNSNKQTSLHCVCMNGQVETVQLLLIHGADPNLPDSQGKTSLHYACMKEHLEVVELLLYHKANPNLPDSDKQTSLHFACLRGHVNVVKCLLNQNTNPNLKNSNEQTSLHCAVISEYAEIVQLLLQHEADPNISDSHKRTSLHFACIHDYVEIVQLLLSYKANPNLPDSYKRTSLHYACENNYVKRVQCWFQSNVVLCIQDNCARNVNIDRKVACVEMVKLLLHSKANPYLLDYHEWSSLHYACLGEYVEIVQLLLSYESENNLADFHEQTMKECVKILQRLLNYNAHLNLSDSDKRTSPHYVCLEKNANTVQHLLNSKAKNSSSL